KATRRQTKSAKAEREESRLGETGIRKLRRKEVFTTPNVFPPTDFEQFDVRDDDDFREDIEPQHCYVCKKDYSTIHHFYDQLCARAGFRRVVRSAGNLWSRSAPHAKCRSLLRPTDRKSRAPGFHH